MLCATCGLLPACHQSRLHPTLCYACAHPAVVAPPCLHCGRLIGIQGRGLCARCYKTPGVRERYPTKYPGYSHRHEPTEEELNLMIAEQMKCLPLWWWKEARACRRGQRERGVKVFVLVKC